MSELSLRDRKKAETRTRIAETAARLFAERGYDAVTVLDVARGAGVAEKTVYNYFPTKEHLVLDRDDEEVARLVAKLRGRRRGTSPSRVIREDALALVDSIGAMPRDQVQGTIGVLAAINPDIRRACLAMMDRHAEALAAELLGEHPGKVSDVLRARTRAYALRLAWVYMIIIDESGRRLAKGTLPKTVVRQIRPVIEGVLDDLERTRAPRP